MRISNSPFGTLRTFDDLREGAPRRLAKLRADAAKLASNVHRNMHVAADPTWRTVRYSGLNEPYARACPGSNSSGRLVRPIISAFSADDLPVRGVAFADEIPDSPIDHRGWYASEDMDNGKVRGIVASLPHGRFVPGYYWSDNGEFVLYVGAREIETDQRECARSADHYAEQYADSCREDNARFRAMTDAESDVESKTRALRESIALRHRPEFGGFDRVRDSIQELRDARETSDDATKAYEGQ